MIIETGIQHIRIKLKLQAQIDDVWSAWSEPDEIAQWWGPKDFSTTIREMDLRPGGEWLLTMHGPDGKNYANRSVFIEVEKRARIVFQHYNPNYRAEVTFTDFGDNTELDWYNEFETPELFNTVIKVFKADEGMQDNIVKLQEHLALKNAGL